MLANKIKSLAKIEIFNKNQNFGQKSKFWPKIKSLGKH